MIGCASIRGEESREANGYFLCELRKCVTGEGDLSETPWRHLT